MSENKYGNPQPHVVLPVLHPDSNEIHNIAVPADTDLGELHKSLSDAGYEHPALNDAIDAHAAQPTEEGTLEESPEFQKANRQIFDSMNHGKTKGENAAYIYANKPSTITGEQFNETAGGGRSMHINVPDDAVALTHVHPDLGQPQLSPADIKVMRDHKIPVYSVSKAGLFSIDGDGKTYQVFKGTDWLSKDFRGNKAFNDGINPDGYTVRVQLKGGKEITVPAGNKDYPLDLMNQIKKNGVKGIDPKEIKNVQTFGKGELKKK